MEQDNPTCPLLSIAIATRNRIPYAISAIQSILEISDPRLELVVQDNNDRIDLVADKVVLDDGTRLILPSVET